MQDGEAGWKVFRKAALKAHKILAAEGDQVGAYPGEAESCQLILTLRLVLLLAAGARGALDIPDIKKAPRPFFQNILRWARDNPPFMRSAFSYTDFFEPQRQAHLWRFKPGEEALRKALDSLMETDPANWLVTWPGDIYPCLLPSAQRKKAGAFYTPWPIVQFIVEKALGPLCYEKTGRGRRKPCDYGKLLSLKALDPVMGGGRFILAAVEYLAQALAAARGEKMGLSHRREVAQNCVFGVDYDPVAVDLARATLWLYLEGPDKPLDYLRNHMQVGDALIGASLDEMDNEPRQLYGDPDQLALFKHETPLEEIAPLKRIAESGRLRHRLEALADLWTAALLEDEDAQEEYPLARISLPHASEERWAELAGRPGFQQARRLALEMEFFHWELRFNEVFPSSSTKDNYGFDAVIGNPPYRRERGSGTGQMLRQAPLSRRWGEGKMDMLALFFHQGLDLLKPGGYLAFIASSYWLNADGASKLRNRLAHNERIKLFVDLAELPIFDKTSGRHGIMVAQRAAKHPHPFRVMRLKNEKESPNRVLQKLLEKSSDCFAEEEILDQRDILDDSGAFNLRDREAERICRKMEDKGVALGELADTSQGVVDNPPALTERMINSEEERNPAVVKRENFEAGEAVFLLPTDHPLIRSLSEGERRFLRPFYRASSIRPYCLPENPDGFLIYLTPDNCPDIAEYPWLREHLERYRVFTEERQEVKEGKIKWWHIHWPRDEALFDGEHLLLPQMGESPQCARSKKPAYAGMSVQMIVPKKGISCGFLVAVLNSRAVAFYLREGGHAKKRGAGLDVSLQALRRLPIPQISPRQHSSRDKARKLLDLYFKLAEKVDM